MADGSSGAHHQVAPFSLGAARDLIDLVAPVLVSDSDLTEIECQVIAREIDAMARVRGAGSMLAQARAVARKVPERIGADSACILHRMHEIAGSGNYESCRGSHPTVRALYDLGWNQESRSELPWELFVGRGHIAPAFYAEEYVRGRLPFALLATLHRGGLTGVVNRAWGFHNTMGFSLGVGLCQATSRAFWLSQRGETPKVVGMAGDGELHEGVTFECLRFVEERNLPNLVLLVDANGKGIEPLERALSRTDLQGFFPEVLEVDGENTEAIAEAIRCALSMPSRAAVVCRTKKGAHSFKRANAKPAAQRFSQRTGLILRKFLAHHRRQSAIFTADMADRFGLRDQVPYVNVSLAETLSVGLTLALPPEVLKFIGTDAKYYLDSMGMLGECAGNVDHVVLLAGKSWGQWGGSKEALNILALSRNACVYEPITAKELVACLERSLRFPKDIHVISLIDAPLSDQDVDCGGQIDGATWLRYPMDGEATVVTFGYAGALVAEAIADLPLGHLHSAALRPRLGRATLQRLHAARVLTVEYNALDGGFGDYLRSEYLLGCISHGISGEIGTVPHAVQLRQHGMDVPSLTERLAAFSAACSQPNRMERAHDEGARTSIP